MRRLVAAALLIVTPTLGTVVGSGSAAGATSPAVQVRAAVSVFVSDGRCTSGDTSSVTVVVDFQQLGGGTTIRCAHGLSAGARGTAALAAAGIGYTGTARWGAAFVCRIQGRPGPTEVLPLSSGGYRETCTDTPPAKAYWSYWQADEGGTWDYSQLGVQAQKVRPGGFEGWSFSMNASSGTNPAPRVGTSLIAPAPPPKTTQTRTPVRPTTSRPAPPTATPRPTTAPPTAPPVTSRATTPRPAPRPTTQQTADEQPTTQQPAQQQPDTPQPPAPQPGSGTRTGTPATPAAPTVDPDAPSTPATAGITTAPTTGGSGPASSTSVAEPSCSATSSRSSTGSALPSPGAPRPGTSGSGPPDSGNPPSSSDAAGVSTPGPVVSTDSAATDPNLTAGQVEPTASSPWPVIGVLALALIAGGAAILIARRRRDNGV